VRITFQIHAGQDEEDAMQVPWSGSLIVVLGLIAAASRTTARHEAAGREWTTDFGVEKSELSATGRNPYFILEPGYQLVLEHGDARLVISVLDATRVVDGVQTRIVEERETRGGRPVEISRNYFAISRRSQGVYYFGEEVDYYKDGMIAGHEGSWLAGNGGARFGLAMPGEPLLGARYYQEIAPKIAMDRAEIVSVSEGLATPDGTFEKCLKVEETTPLEPRDKEYKLYARGVGLLTDGALRLVKHGRGIDKRK
jgi:hypothetical protein